MFRDNVTPRARHWAMPFLVSGLAFVWSLFIESQPVQMIAYVVTVTCAAWALVNFLHHAGQIFVSMRNQAREIDFQLSENYKLTMLKSMTDFQVKAYRAGYHVIGVYPSSDGITIDKLADEEVYLYFAWYVLVNSTDLNVYPINRFQPGTYHFDMLGDHAVDDYQQARNFHTWLVRYSYAYWGSGNQSASWKRGFNPKVVLHHLGMDYDTYKPAETEE